MIDITKLYCDFDTTADDIRYGEKNLNKTDPQRIYKTASSRKPIVVWNITQTCNLKCLHCYSHSENKIYKNELTTHEALKVIDDLSAFKIPALLFSGGEPLTRKDLFELVDYAKYKGLKPVLSTNGTLIDENTAQKIKNAGFTYVGISLDGIGKINDDFRGMVGAYNKTVNAFKNLKDLDQKVGLRMTLTEHNIDDLENIFDFIEEHKIDRACFYHLVNSGRGSNQVLIPHDKSRKAIDTILYKTKNFVTRGLKVNILTVDNHVDGVYLYLKLLEENSPHSRETFQRLKWNGGALNSTGVGIGAIDFQGNVHPDQFWQHYSIGNVRVKDFSEIWNSSSDPILIGLRDRKKLLKGKCSKCKWIDICGGSSRVRADLTYGDPWMEDPSCYLTYEEITF